MTHRLPARERSTARRIGGHVAALAFGAALQRVVALFSQVAVARIVGPSALGALAVAQALGVFASIFTDGGLTTLALRRIVREPEHRDQLASITLAVQLALAAAGLVVLDVVALVGPWDGRTGVLIIALSPSLLFSAYNLSYVLQSSEQMGTMAIYRALASILPSIASVVLVAATKDTLWVAISTDAGLLLSAVLVHRHLRRHLGLRLVRVSWQQARETLRAGLPFVVSGALLIIPPTSVTVIVALSLGNGAAGIYSAAWQLSFAAITIAALVVDAIYPEMVRRWDAGTRALTDFLGTVLRLVCRVLFPPTVVVIFAAEPLTRLLFGAGFDATAPILRILIVIVPFGFLWVILGQSLTAANAERTLVARTFIVTAVTLVAVPIAAQLGELAAVAWTVVALSVVQAGLYSTGPLGRVGFVIGVVARELPYALVPAAVCALGRWAIGPQLPVAIAAGLVGLIGWEAARGLPTLRGVRALSAARTGPA